MFPGQTDTHTHTEPTAVANPRLCKRTHDIFDGTAWSIIQPAIIRHSAGSRLGQMPAERQRNSINRICWVGRNSIAGVILDSTWLQIVYWAVHLDWKLQNNHEKCSISQKKQFYRILLLGNLEELAKNRQVGIICHINLKRNQESGNRQQTNRQTDKVLYPSSTSR